jgi:hypothetical protein
MPLARDVVRELAISHGGCIRPVQLRRTDLQTGHAEQVLVPCGHTLAAVCPGCAERKRALRAAQCREGWHLEAEPSTTPDDPDDEQLMWTGLRAEAQQRRDHDGAAGQDTAEDDELIGDLDEQITRSGIRGKVLPDHSGRRHRSTRRRQDAPDLPRRKIAPRTIGKTYTGADGKTFRPSMFITLTCPSYGRVLADGTPADPGRYDYTRAARDALHFAALFDRLIQNLRRFLGYDVQYFAAVEPQRRLARTSTSPSAAPCPAPNCGKSSPPPTTRSGGHPPTRQDMTTATCPSGTNRAATTSTPPPGKSSPPGTKRSTLSASTTNRCTSPGSASDSTPRASSPDRATPPAASATSPNI